MKVLNRVYSRKVLIGGFVLCLLMTLITWFEWVLKAPIYRYLVWPDSFGMAPCDFCFTLKGILMAVPQVIPMLIILIGGLYTLLIKRSMPCKLVIWAVYVTLLVYILLAIFVVVSLWESIGQPL